MEVEAAVADEGSEWRPQRVEAAVAADGGGRGGWDGSLGGLRRQWQDGRGGWGGSRGG